MPVYRCAVRAGVGFVDQPVYGSPHQFGDVERKQFDQGSQYQREMKVRGLIDLYRKNGFKYYPDNSIEIEAYNDFLSAMTTTERSGHASSYEKKTLVQLFTDKIQRIRCRHFFEKFDWWNEFQL